MFAIAYFTGEEESSLHIYSSYAIGGLITARVLWGLIGGKYARFSEFIRPSAKVSTYIKSLMRGKPDYYFGHNSAGGYMIVTLLIMLAITTITGLKVYGIKGHSLLAKNTAISFISTANADEDKKEGSRKHYLDNRQGEGFKVSEKEEALVRATLIEQHKQRLHHEAREEFFNNPPGQALSLNARLSRFSRAPMC